MKCKYVIKGHEFDNEFDLDNFLLLKSDYMSDYKDLVFSRTAEALTTMRAANNIEMKTADLKRRYYKDVEYIDGDTLEDYKLPYMGVTKYLSLLKTSSGNPLFPIFIKENFFANRKSIWTNPGTRNLQILYNNDPDNGVFSEDEIDLIFDGDKSKVRALDSKEAEMWCKILEKKWDTQGKMGTAWHAIMETYFGHTKDSNGNITYNFTLEEDELLKLIKKKVDLQMVPVGVLEQTLKFANDLKQNLFNKYGSEIDFFPELHISGKLGSVTGNVENLIGYIDLAVVDRDGNMHVFDYKTSPKPYYKYSSAKIYGFQYQLEIYNRLLRKFGINLSNENDISIIPVQLEDFKLINKNEAIESLNTGDTEYKSAKKATFAYKNIKYDKNNMFRDLRPAINANSNLINNVDSFLPVAVLSDVDTEDGLKNIREDMQNLFPDQHRLKEYTLESVRNELDEAGAFVKKGKYYEYLPKGSNKPITSTTEEGLTINVLKLYQKWEKNAPYTLQAIKDAIQAGIEGRDKEVNEILKYVKTSHLMDEHGTTTWFRDMVSKYSQPYYQIHNSKIADALGIIIMKNTLNNQVDFLKITGKNIKAQHYKQVDKNGKKVKLRNHSSLIYAHESDLHEKAKADSLMLAGIEGNIEMIETMLLINKLTGLFNDSSDWSVGKLQVISPYNGQGLSARNEELLYSYRRLRDFKPITNDRIKDGKIKFSNYLDLARNDMITTLSQNSEIQSIEGFDVLVSQLDEAVDNTDKIQELQNIMHALQEAGAAKEVKSSLSTNDAKTRLYNECALALGELKGMTFRQQIADHAKYLEQKTLSALLLKGVNGSYIDNPGNLDSQTLNILTKVVNEGYQNVRNELSTKIPKIRRAVEELKKAQNFGWLTERTIGNQATLYKHMIDDTIPNDLVLKNPDDLTNGMTPGERKFVKFFLEEINKTRWKGQLGSLERWRKTNDRRYYRLPLARGDMNSNMAMEGLWESFKNKMENLKPQKALEELRATAEGIFTEEESVKLNGDDSLFSMNNMFNRTDGEETEKRLQAIEEKGKGYFEINLETLMMKHALAYSMQDNLQEIMPMVRATMTYLTVSAEEEQNTKYVQDVQYTKDYIKAVMKNEPIDETIAQTTNRAFLGKLKSAASFMALAFSPVQGLYQTLQGLWVDLSLIYRKPDGTNAFTFKNFLKAGKIVYADAFHHSDNPTKLSLLNELYAINDMDMNSYAKNIASDRHGIFNFNNFAYKFTSRPDYYSRMTILVAKMIEDGTWDAYTVKDGKLVYNIKNDKRFYHLTHNIKGEEYNKEYMLYVAMAKQFETENTKNEDGTYYRFDASKIELPSAYTTIEMESIKSISDLIYGYYSHEKKSLIHYTFLGSLFMQMKTYWSGKKNQYLAPGGVKVQGHWVQRRNSAGKLLYYDVTDGNPDTYKPLVDHNTGYPVMQWEGQWQEGIIVTLSDIARAFTENCKTGSGLLEAITQACNEKWNADDPDLMRAYRNNLKQLFYDIMAFFVIGGIIGGFLADWEKDLAKEAREYNSFEKGLQASMLNLLALSVKSSASDFAAWDGIGRPLMQWTPFSFESFIRLGNNIVTTAFGDRTVWGCFTNTFAVTKTMKPLMETIAPLKEKE